MRVTAYSTHPLHTSSLDFTFVACRILVAT